MLNCTHARQKGQAMTEMLVASAFVLVPLFLIVPMLGKYIDMQHAAVSGARFVAWERTVKLAKSNRDKFQPSGFNKPATPFINRASLAHSMKSKLLSEAHQYNADDNKGRKLWRYHNGNSMLADIKVSDIDSRQKIHGPLSGVVDVFGQVLAGVTSVLTLGKTAFDVVKTNGVSNAKVEIAVNQAPLFTSLKREPDHRLLDIAALKFSARAQVYSLSWSAGGVDHLAKKVTPLAPTAIIADHIETVSDKLKSLIPFSLPPAVTAQNIVSVALLSPEIDDKQLVFGHMDMSVLPRDKYLQADRKSTQHQDDINKLLDSKLCNKQGYCRND
ncbi:MAG: hypothetical protein OFPII_16070 [Osedax symbiont Rs1]|nr:MAG: hypothetical protein OFPII_16070 [Osedax symbiont Rs1]